MISIKNLKLGYIREYYALYDINLEIAKGEKIAIVGEENSGKTSFLRIIAQLQKPTSGEITINDIPLSKLDYSVDLSVAFVPTYPILLEKKSVRKNIEYVLKIRQISSGDLLNCIDAVMKDFGIEKYADTKVKFLTMYQKRLLQFAMLSIREKIDILLIDDIFDLPPKEKKTIVEIAKSFASKEGTTTIVALSDMEIAKEFNAKIINMSLGSFQVEGNNDNGRIEK